MSDESPPGEGDNNNEVWGKRSDVLSDVGSAFDGLNLSTVPSQVCFRHVGGMMLDTSAFLRGNWLIHILKCIWGWPSRSP